MKAYPKTILTLIFIVSIDLICVAQATPPPPSPEGMPPVPVGLPIDGGLLACFVIGSLLGIRALYKGLLKRN